MMKTKIEKLLSYFLIIISAHSLLVGIGLIVLPFQVFDYLGFADISERFFPAQGGVFHIVMSAAYFMAAINLRKNRQLIIFTILVKFSATLFLSVYFIFIAQVALAMLSCITDFLMGTVVLLLYKELVKREYFEEVIK